MNKKQKSLTNKGFSLVELIIVIAIMAVLVGALAPQYVKYLNKSKYASDVQIADALRQAIEVTLIDPTITNPTSLPSSDDNTKISDASTSDFWKEVHEVMGTSGHADLVGKLNLDKVGTSTDPVKITYWVVGDNDVTVKISGGKYTGNYKVEIK